MVLGLQVTAGSRAAAASSSALCLSVPCGFTMAPHRKLPR